MGVQSGHWCVGWGDCGAVQNESQGAARDADRALARRCSSPLGVERSERAYWMGRTVAVGTVGIGVAITPPCVSSHTVPTWSMANERVPELPGAFGAAAAWNVAADGRVRQSIGPTPAALI